MTIGQVSVSCRTCVSGRFAWIRLNKIWFESIWFNLLRYERVKVACSLKLLRPRRQRQISLIMKQVKDSEIALVPRRQRTTERRPTWDRSRRALRRELTYQLACLLQPPRSAERTHRDRDTHADTQTRRQTDRRTGRDTGTWLQWRSSGIAHVQPSMQLQAAPNDVTACIAAVSLLSLYLWSCDRPADRPPPTCRRQSLVLQRSPQPHRCARHAVNYIMTARTHRR